MPEELAAVATGARAIVDDNWNEPSETPKSATTRVRDRGLHLLHEYPLEGEHVQPQPVLAGDLALVADTHEAATLVQRQRRLVHRRDAGDHGMVALRAGQKITWDARAERVTDVSAANAYLRKEYRKPWSLES